MPENVYEFRYSGQDVASAQRMRFLASQQLKVILLLWLGTAIYLALPIFFPGKIPGMTDSNWGIVLQVSLGYLVSLVVLVFGTPWIDYLFRRFWHIKLELRFNEKMMRVNVAGKPGGLQLQWGQLRKVLENKRVYIIEYDVSNKYLILPKTAFNKPGSEKRFRDLLERRSTIPLLPAEKIADDADEKTDDTDKRPEKRKAIKKKQRAKR